MVDTPTHSPAPIAVRCDAHASSGLGHLIRQTALVEELLHRGHKVSLFGTCDVEWGARQVQRLGLDFEDVADDEVAGECLGRGIRAVMIDGYDIPASVGKSFQENGIGVAAMVDGVFGRHQMADVYVDQNLGSEVGDEIHTWLVGLEYVLLRDTVLNRRGQTIRAGNEVPRVLVVFGGSDPFGGCAVAAEVLLATDEPVEVVAIAATDEQRHILARLPTLDTQSVKILDTQDDLAAVAVECDLAISAAGSSVWEFACLGVPTALVCVTANQRVGYEATVGDLATGLGELNDLKSSPEARQIATDVLAKLLQQPSRRARMAAIGRDLVDGRGRQRVADALQRLAQR